MPHTSEKLSPRYTLPDLGIAAQAASGVPCAENAPFVNDVGAVGDRKRFADIVVSNQNSDAAGLQIGNNLLQIQHGDRVNARKRLVQQDERRVNAQARAISTRRRSPPDSA